MKDYYKVLGVPKDESEENIKKAYRRLAHEYHPDKPGGNEAKFKEINEAYQVLSNKEKRAQYDRFGQVFENGAQPGAGGGTWNPFGEGFSSWGFGGNAEDIGDIFGDIFEQFGGGKRKTHIRGSDIEIEDSRKIGILCAEVLRVPYDGNGDFEKADENRFPQSFDQKDGQNVEDESKEEKQNEEPKVGKSRNAEKLV